MRWRLPATAAVAPERTGVGSMITTTSTFVGCILLILCTAIGQALGQALLLAMFWIHWWIRAG